jgi:hypothetical protein
VKEQKGGGKPPHSKAALRAAGCRILLPCDESPGFVVQTLTCVIGEDWKTHRRA